MSFDGRSFSVVTGQTYPELSSHRRMCLRSKLMPLRAMTGSAMTWLVRAHLKWLGGAETTLSNPFFSSCSLDRLERVLRDLIRAFLVDDEDGEEEDDAMPAIFGNDGQECE